MEISHQYTKHRSDFGRQTMFCEHGPIISDSIATDISEHKRYILRNPVHQLTQNTPCFSERLINTIRAEYSTTGINHAEGGWPKDVLLTDPEATQRYRRKIEKDDAYVHCVQAVAPGIEHYLNQNNAIDMYRTYYSGLPAMPPPAHASCRTVNVFRDPPPARPVSSICWQPEGGGCFAVAYLAVDADRRPARPVLAYVWDVENPNAPVQRLHPTSGMLDLQYNPREPAQLAAGLLSGQVAVWDRRRGQPAVLECAPHVAHRDMARQVTFINAKSGQEFFSSGPDGVCKWWDVRNMSATTDEMIIDPPQTSFDVPSMATSLGVSSLEFEPTIPTRFMVGTENGIVVCGNRKGKTPSEQLPAKFPAHVGPVWSLERNPGFLKNFLTVGDWTVRVWSEDCRDSAVMWSPPLRHKITAAAWSPQRLSLMVAMQWDGKLALWDWLRRQHAPVLSMQVCHEPLLRTKFHEQATMVACGSQLGNVYMVELTQSLAESLKNDKVLLTLMFERESKRERILEARLREIRLKQRQAEESAGTELATASALELEGALGDRDLADATAAFAQTVRRELALM